MLKCKKCHTAIKHNYCPHCGQPAYPKRIDGHYLLNEIKQILNFEKGFFYTIRELLIRPGESIRDFITTDRNRLVKPVVFIVLTSLIYTLIVNLFQIEEQFISFRSSDLSATENLFQWMQNNYGYTNIIMGIFIAFWIKLFFKSYNYNFFEILILLCFVLGMGMLILSALALIQSLTGLKLIKITAIVFFIYIIWAIGQFFEKDNYIKYLKVPLTYMLGMFSFTLTAVIIGFIIDWIV